MVYSNTILLAIITVTIPSIPAQTDQPPDAQPSATNPGAGRYLFPAGLPGVVVIPVRDVQVLLDSYARASDIWKHSVTDFEVADCATTGDEMVKETTTIHCPAGCAAYTKAAVWGTGTYKGDSSMCRAAIHSGKLRDSAGGFVTVNKQPLGMIFPGSARNGVKSTFFVINSKRLPDGDQKSFVVRKYKHVIEE